MADEVKLLAVCDRCKVKERLSLEEVQGWSSPAATLSFFVRHAGHNFTGCRVVEADNPCPNLERSYSEEETGA